MILLHCIGNVTDASADMTAIIMKAVPALIYLGSSKVIKKGLSPIGRIDISAAAGDQMPDECFAGQPGKYLERR